MAKEYFGIVSAVSGWVSLSLIVTAGCSGGAPSGTRPGGDVAASTAHPTDAERQTFEQACTAFLASTSETIGANLAGVTRAMEPILASQTWVRDRFKWFALHRIDAAFYACGVDDERSTTLLRAMTIAAREDSDVRAALREERLSFCRGASRHPASVAGDAWTPAARIAWEGRCLRLLDPTVILVPPPVIATGTIAAPVDRVTVVVEGKEVDHISNACASLSTQREAMVKRTLDPEAWITFGRILAGCTPDREPWKALGLAEGRDEFVRLYVSPFITGDLIRKGLLRNGAPDVHRGILVAYSPEDAED